MIKKSSSGAECGSSPLAVDGARHPRPEPAPSVSPGGAGSILSPETASEVSEPLSLTGPHFAEADPVREVGLHGGSLARRGRE
jgi:hypothetical protein